MEILISVDYVGRTSEMGSSGSFAVDPFEFSIDPDREAARVAYLWIEKIRREVDITKIVQVTYNEANDITHLITEKFNQPLDDTPW
ncbi:hypothetical protein [Bacillus infantis]|uniref:hypothetical protein n=1 Tax=Bacillus infantis TaxID=324767 RepID=UPI00321AB504